MNSYHTPVLLVESIESLNVKKNSWYIDATLGGGGHSFEILRLGGNVLGIDQDTDAIDFVTQKFKQQLGKELVIEKGNFRNIKQIVEKHDLVGKIEGILFDFGVSSYQIDKSGRGFSFRKDEQLDMRMDTESLLTAKEIVNTWSEEELEEIISRYGEEYKAAIIAKAIVEARGEKKIETSRELGEIIRKAIRGEGDIHPATKTFMALRIVVNDELRVIEQGLEGGMEILSRNGRMSVITFHSLEDRIVKRMFQRFEQEGMGRVLTKKPIVPKEDETTQNRRARSAKLRVIEKI